MSKELYAEIEYQLSRGDHRAAAIGLEEMGDLGRARSLYEGLFDYTEAGRLAEAQGDELGALTLYLKAGENQRAEVVRRQLLADLSDELPEAMALFEDAGYALQAAELAESIGKLVQAAQLYKSAGSHKRAAVLQERLGRLKEAGESYEAGLLSQPEDSEAHLGLGRVLQRFGRHREAIDALHVCVNDQITALESSRRAAFSFFKLGYLESGRTALALAGLSRNLDPDEFIKPFEDELDHEGEGHRLKEGQSSSGAIEGRYRLEKPLGGRNGAVYQGRDLLNGRSVVLRFFAGGESQNGDFYDELERLQHAGVRGMVKVLEINRSGGFVVKDFVDGISLMDAIKSPTPPNAMRCRGFGVQILETLGGAHRAGVLHGALSPAAVRLAPGGATLVDDWGVRHIEKRLATQTGGAESSFAYRAPEINLGRSFDLRADLYSIAAILYRCLVGRPPLMGRGAEGFDGWPDAFGVFFLKALAANSEDRFPNQDTFGRALKALPWYEVAERRLDVVVEPELSPEVGEGPRFVTEREPRPGELVTARDVLLGRDVRLLLLPELEDRPVALVDRLCALAGPEVPTFQDILRYDAQSGAIILEAMSGESVVEIVARQGAIAGQVALEAGGPLLNALAGAHSAGVGLGFLRPENILFDGDGLRAPIERSLLLEAPKSADAIEDDALQFWVSLLLVVEGRRREDPGPEALLEALEERGALMSGDAAHLLEQVPAARGSLAPFPQWFDEVRRAVDSCTVRKTVLERLERVLGGIDLGEEAATFLEERKKALGVIR